MIHEGRPEQFLRDWADETCESIARHTLEFRGFSSRCRLSLALVTLGSGQDLMGSVSSCIHPDDIKTICDLWPRAGYCEGLSRHTKMEVGSKPACLFEDCAMAFDPAMFEVQVYKNLRGDFAEYRAEVKSKL